MAQYSAICMAYRIINLFNIHYVTQEIKLLPEIDTSVLSMIHERDSCV